MVTEHPRSLFVNLAVADLNRSMAFFSELGFDFDTRFTNENAACIVVNEQTYVMLLTEVSFRSFTQRNICDTSTCTEAMIALQCQSREEVDEIVNAALGAGGEYAMAPQDHGFMYGWSFYDPDGHHWEVLWMNTGSGQQ